mgnify:CR=1 FL=1
MNITLKRTEEQVELIKAMASKNRNVAYEAQAAAAEFVGPVLSEVMNNAPTLSNMFTSFQFNDDDNPSIPLDLYHDISDEDYLEVYSQSVPGGLPSNTITPLHSELKFATYRMETAVDFDRRYAARSRLDVVSKTFSRIAQELLQKQEFTSANLLLGVLANAETNGSGHVVASASENQFLIADVNTLITHAKRLNTAWNGGTPITGTRGVSDLLVSPEIMGEVRAMAYNPINTRGNAGGASINVDGTDQGDVSVPGSGVIPATEQMRNALYANAGASELYGIALTEINELGVGQRFNEVFKGLIGSTTNKKGDVGHDTGGTFGANDEVIIGIDRGRESLMRAIAVDSETGAELNLVADDQYTARQSKIGYYGSIEEGRMVLDKRAVTGIVV